MLLITLCLALSRSSLAFAHHRAPPLAHSLRPLAHSQLPPLEGDSPLDGVMWYVFTDVVPITMSQLAKITPVYDK